MKIVKNIFGIAANRSGAIKKLNRYAETLAWHVAKCVIYGRSLSDANYEHWIEGEICDCLADANTITIKPKGKKLKKEDYMSSIFDKLGDAKIDAKLVLKQFKSKNQKDYNYPDFEITDKLIDKMFVTSQNIINVALPILTTNNEMRKQDFVPIIYDAIAKE